MFQHLLLSLVAPPLLLAGIPTWFWQWLFGGPNINRVANVVLNRLGKPWSCKAIRQRCIELDCFDAEVRFDLA
jgi:cytochrome c oxidase assembly factor CtaG